MAISEEQLDTWTHLGSVQQSSRTYQSIKEVIEHADAPYAARQVDCFLQGSYWNDTNIYGDSDVDIVVRTRALFHYNLDRLSPPEQLEFKQHYPNVAQYQLAHFRTDVVSWLQEHFGSDLDTLSSKKVLKIKPNQGRRSADILLVAPHKSFTRFLSPRTEDQRLVEGVLFISGDGKQTINYPKQHSENMTAKHQSSNEWLKPVIRIYKNMRNRMIERNYIGAETAPSYFIEGLLSNVPAAQFGVSWRASVENTFAWVDANASVNFVCGNGLHPLFQDNEATSWSPESYISWLNGMKRLWNNWP